MGPVRLGPANRLRCASPWVRAARRRGGGATAALAALVGLAATPAEAHLVGVEFGGFYGGGLHLVSSPGHLAMILALTLAAAAAPVETARWAIPPLPVGLALGCAGALATTWPLALEPAIVAAIGVAGVLAVIARPVPGPVLAMLGLAIGLLAGAENGLPARDGPVPPLLYTAGVTAAGTVLGLLMLAGLAALGPHLPWMTVARRVIGSWLAAVGLIALAGQAAGL
ncbi:MAG: HupE/UreJ family protein [Pseudomonadota bacterium]